MTDTPPDAADAPPPSAGRGRAPNGQVVIKKYANRRLYNTATSIYVTLDHLAEMVKAGVDFVVYDARTGEDITRGVLAQIIFDEESRGQNLLPIQFLRQLIRFYGAQMQSLVPSYLEMSLDALTKQQGRMGEQFPGAFTPPQSYKLFEEQVRQNMTMFDRAMKMFTPLGFARPGEAAPEPEPADEASGETLAELRRRVEEMQQQIARLAAKED